MSEPGVDRRMAVSFVFFGNDSVMITRLHDSATVLHFRRVIRTFQLSSLENRSLDCRGCITLTVIADVNGRWREPWGVSYRSHCSSNLDWTARSVWARPPCPGRVIKQSGFRCILLFSTVPDESLQPSFVAIARETRATPQQRHHEIRAPP